MELGEFDLIEEIKKRFPLPDGVVGIGDDCAILPQRDGRETLVSTDMLVDGVHFLLPEADPYDLGWKSAAVNISDIAGMGGRPEGIFLSFALPKTMTDSWILSFIDGFKELCDMFSCPLLGGDTTSSPDRLCISVTVMGSSVSSGSAHGGAGFVPGAARRRSAAMVGDLICVTGNLGDSAAGLQLILNRDDCGDVSKSELGRNLISRHYRPLPRVDVGLVLAATDGVHAMMDVSDGVASDLRHILRASNVSALVDVETLPISDKLRKVCSQMTRVPQLSGQVWDPVRFALEGGEDYELLFTATGKAVDELVSRGCTIYPIGRILPLEGTVSDGNAVPAITWLNSSEDYLGFRHF